MNEFTNTFFFYNPFNGDLLKSLRRKPTAYNKKLLTQLVKIDYKEYKKKLKSKFKSLK